MYACMCKYASGYVSKYVCMCPNVICMFKQRVHSMRPTYIHTTYDSQDSVTLPTLT